MESSGVLVVVLIAVNATRLETRHTVRSVPRALIPPRTPRRDTGSPPPCANGTQWRWRFNVQWVMIPYGERVGRAPAHGGGHGRPGRRVKDTAQMGHGPVGPWVVARRNAKRRPLTGVRTQVKSDESQVRQNEPAKLGTRKLNQTANGCQWVWVPARMRISYVRCPSIYSIHRLALHLQFTLNLAHCPHTGGARVNRYLKSHRWHAYRWTALAAHARHIQTSSAGGHARIFFDAPLLPLQPTTSHAS